MWRDFWTGTIYNGGTTIEAKASLDKIPLFVKSGSIIPYYTSVEKNIDTNVPLEIHVFDGENTSFDLYEDDGETLDYKNGDYSIIPFKWNEYTKEFIIGARMGNYAMKDRDFIIKLNGGDVVKRIRYNGKEMKIILK